MKNLVLCLVTFLLLRHSNCSMSERSVSNDKNLDEDLASKSMQRDLLGAKETSAVAPEATPEVAKTKEPAQCPGVSVGMTVSMNEDDLVFSFTTSSAFICCQSCELNAECTIWRRNRRTGLCHLFNADKERVMGLPSRRFDAGGLLEDNIVADEPSDSFNFIDEYYDSANSPDEEPFFDEVFSEEPLPGENFQAPASAIAFPKREIPLCVFSLGITYPDGAVVGTGTVNSASDCCNLCRFSNNCKSWFFNNQSRRCIHNGNVPVAQNRDSSRFRGGTV